MPNAFSTQNISEDLWYEIEDEFSDDRGGRVSSGGKKGRKTLENIARTNAENAIQRRKDKAKGFIKDELKHFPFDRLDKSDYLEEGIEDYASWVVTCIDNRHNSTFSVVDFDKDVEYSYAKSSGPGGQNVNKRETAVYARHIITGIYVRNSEERGAEINKKLAQGDLEKRVLSHIKNWSTYLESTPKDQREHEIKEFMEDLSDI